MKDLIEKIVTNDNHSIPLMTAIYLSTMAQSTQSQSTSKKITKQRAEELLDEWCTAGYFFITGGDSVTLGPRGIGEFRDTMRTKFGDFILSCRLCNAIVLTVMIFFY